MKRYPILIALFLVFGLTMCKEVDQEIQFHKSHEPSRASVPFSDVVETRNLLFLTGQIGKNHTTGALVEGGIKVQTEQVIKNIRAVLNHHDLDLDQVVKCTVILRDIEDFNDFNTVYKRYFTKKPARTTFAASGLAGGASIEIDVIAAK